MKPFLKWIGGKSKLIPQYQELNLIPKEINTYFEPFLGGGAMFFHLAKNNLIKRALLSDINEDLVISYEQVKKNVDFVKTQVNIFAGYNSPNYYEWMRKNRSSENNIDIAARFIYLNKSCRSGIWRVNQDGQFNVPMGDLDQKIYQPDLLENSSLALNSIPTGFLNKSFFELSHLPVPGDFVFLDPPYHNTFKEYNTQIFTEKDQIKLRDLCIEYANSNVNFILCNSDTGFIRNIYSDRIFTINEVKRPGVVNSLIEKRQKIQELVITKRV